MDIEWKNYITDDSKIIESWLDEETVRLTGLEDGWDADVRYWRENTDRDCFWCKTVYVDGSLAGALYLIEWRENNESGFSIGEIIVDPSLRGKGLGTQAVTELTEHSAEIIGKRINRLDAVVFSSNAASIKMFKKAGFQLKERENGDSALDAVKNL